MQNITKGQQNALSFHTSSTSRVKCGNFQSDGKRDQSIGQVENESNFVDRRITFDKASSIGIYCLC